MTSFLFGTNIEINNVIRDVGRCRSRLVGRVLLMHVDGDGGHAAYLRVFRHSIAGGFGQA